MSEQALPRSLPLSLSFALSRSLPPHHLPSVLVSVEQSGIILGSWMMCCEKGDTFREHGIHGEEGACVNPGEEPG